jgi:hypothetical protein
MNNAKQTKATAKSIKYLLIFLIVSFTSLGGYGQDTYADDILNKADRLLGEKLTGLKKVKTSIFTSIFRNESFTEYLSENQIQTEAEIRLRRAGLYYENASSYIYINVGKEESNGYYIKYEINIELKEKALLERTKNEVSVTTWHWIRTRKVEKSQLQDDIRVGIGEGIDQFIEDYKEDNSLTTKNNIPTITDKKTPQQPPPKTKQDDSPFTATYVGGNSAPTIEVFNDSNRTMYFDFGQGKMTPYVIASGGRKKITITEGSYNYKASAPRVKSDEGQENFKNGYIYTWRFYIVTVLR